MIYSPRVLPEGAARGQHTRGINHITTSSRPINGLFLHWRGFLKGCKNTLKKNSCIVLFLLFYNTPCWHEWDSQVSRPFNYVNFLKSHFELVVLLVGSEC